jgi:CO/xanthine dehydrogenase Mo-binding subunit
MNKLAEALDMDPVEMRMKNVLREGSLLSTQTAVPKGVSLVEVVTKCASEAGWDDAPNGDNDHRPLYSLQTLATDPAMQKHGRGFACGLKNVGFSFGAPEGCDAKIVLHGKADIEKVTLYHALAEVGQGSHTAAKQMAAAAVGVDLSQVELVLSDTATSGNSGSVSASRMTWMAGNSIRLAAEKALEAWENEDRPAIGDVRFIPPPTEPYDEETGYCMPNFSYGYMAQAAEVTVDIETGHIRIDRIVSTHDVGKAINPNLIEGQIEGAVVQATGYALTENLVLENGRIKNPVLSQYIIPGINDIPDRVDSVIMEIPDPVGPWGARGMAEMPFITLAPAVVAAVHDATGVWFDQIPLTPERVVAGLRKAGIGV